MVRCVTALGSDSCSDCGWVDYVQSPMPSDWNSIGYVYDPSGRRIEKKYDGQAVMKYLYDADHIIVEYDATGALVHKYIYGPGVDQPICMIDVADANATYYYHFDGLGSVIALTDSSGAVANLYEYSIFGEVSASDPNHPNRFLFTGREFDSETGLYYYRARYYNPYIGRFLQTDPIGYGDGMNWYAYCRNNPICLLDPTGLIRVAFYDGGDMGGEGLLDGKDFRELADDDWFEYSFNMREIPDDLKESGISSSADYIIYILSTLKEKGADISDVYFFDHGWGGGNNLPGEPRDLPAGLELGDSYYSVAGPTKVDPGHQNLKDFADRLGRVLRTPNPVTGNRVATTINLRSCYGGTFADEVATWSGCITTGWTDEVVGAVVPEGLDPDSPWLSTGFGPDYSGTGQYLTYAPTGSGGQAELADKKEWWEYRGY